MKFSTILPFIAIVTATFALAQDVSPASDALELEARDLDILEDALEVRDFTEDIDGPTARDVDDLELEARQYERILRAKAARIARARRRRRARARRLAALAN